MKLLVSWMQALGRYVSREFHYTMHDLVPVHGWRQVEPWVLSRHAESPKARLVELLGEVPETILFWETYDLFNAIQPALRLGAAGVPQAHSLQQAHQLCGLGTAEALFRKVRAGFRSLR